MGMTWCEPGCDADFLIGTTNGFWSATGGTVSVATDFVHGAHVKSLKYGVNTAANATTPSGVISDAGGRLSFYFYMNALPTATANIARAMTAAALPGITIRVTSAGVVQMWRGGTLQLGSNGPTLSTGQWYRISVAMVVTSASVNQFKFWVDGVLAASDNSSQTAQTGIVKWQMGINVADTTMDWRTNDHYVDDSSSLTDTGDIWVTAKRAFSNGTLNEFTTQIGAGGSGYGSGHAPQVNERALSTTNGWSFATSAATKTEEYTIEGKAVGDIDISAATIVDFMGWVSAKSLASETGSIIVAGVSSNISLTSTITQFRVVAGSTTYPAGGTDIGIATDNISSTTVSLYECGIVVAYIPAATGAALFDPSLKNPLYNSLLRM